MKNLLSSLLFCLLTINFSFAQHTSVEGQWYGALNVMGNQARLSFEITNTNDTLIATMGSPDEGVSGIPMEDITFSNDALTIVQPKMMMSYVGVVNKDFTEVNGTYSQAGQSFPLILGREEIKKKEIKRPQEPKAPFPYYSEDVEYTNENGGHTLAGTLTLPSKDGVYPVVILISGSGPQDRNEELLGHKPFLVIADHLTRKGIGVLRFDDRGTAKSKGDHSTATSADFATDVEAGINYLKTRKEVNKKKIGLMGHSEGGLIAPMVASKSKDIAFIVMLAGPGIPGDQILLQQSELIALAEGMEDTATIKNELAMAVKMYDIIKTNSQEDASEKLAAFIKKEVEKMPEEERKAIPDVDAMIQAQISTLNSTWFRFFLSFDPAPVLQKVKCPVLAVNGEKDLQVPCAVNLEAIEAALKKGKNKRYKTMAFPNLNHLFQTTETGKVSEYGELEETFSPKALDAVTNWLLALLSDKN
jgi:fermentation-respiration switch protein FrsA (DUF1100 family)